MKKIIVLFVCFFCAGLFAESSSDGLQFMGFQLNSGKVNLIKTAIKKNMRMINYSQTDGRITFFFQGEDLLAKPELPSLLEFNFYGNDILTATVILNFKSAQSADGVWSEVISNFEKEYGKIKTPEIKKEKIRYIKITRKGYEIGFTQIYHKNENCSVSVCFSNIKNQNVYQKDIDHS